MPINKKDAYQINFDAAKATEAEHNMTLWQGLKLYPKAIGWSILLSAAIIMEGFDIRQFGVQLPDITFEIAAAWQTGLSNGAVVGELLGLMLNGWIADRFGYRKTMIGALLAVNFLIFIVFFASRVEQLLVGLILLGIPWGVFQTLTTTYAAEVCPVALLIGQFLASAVLKGVATREDHWAYRIPYALQWIWPIPLIVGIFLAPESPWWLVRQGRVEEAKTMVLRLTSANQLESFNADETIAIMVHTNEIETAATESIGYLDSCGSGFMGYSTYFYLQAGLDTSNAFTMSLVQYSLGAIGVFCLWALITKFGRRTLYIGGLVILFVLLVLTGSLGLVAKTNTGEQWAIGSMLFVYTFIYDASVGPVCYSLVAELSSTRLRQKTIVLARNLYNVGGIINNVLTPNMLNPSAWNWGAKSGFFWAGSCSLCIFWCYFRLPEPKVSARKFASTSVDTFTGAIETNDSKEKMHVQHIEKA
ncbi:hypothetical protein COCVIDRAFT_37456 [Bipolaris victoriae FI3]|uniref:Major facilitator superfamily (MFS) profile domain-containing protein n=1 Tax=Bipolaris victoriae (strain FI3) TaxID=930091 RepID=W7EA43_BIPV3|nr:hypothetical protein COCVIDRAFT_37456 [Bipolaris victoriae FI3]